MLDKKRVLVFPCGSEIGLELHRALSRSAHIETIGGSSVSSNHGKFVYKEYVEGIPYVDSPHLIDRINEVVEGHKIDYIFPAHDSVVIRLAENVSNLRCEIVGSPAETCRVCRSKRMTYETLDSCVRTPRLHQPTESHIQFPIFMKPDVGQGSKGTHIAESVDDMRYHLDRQTNLLLMEYLPGREFTVECFTDRHKKLAFVGPRERVRISNGIVMDTYAVKDTRLDEMAQAINRRLEFRGAWFFQAKMDSRNEPVLLEVAPRTAGGMGLFRNLGVNLALMSIYDRMGLDVSILLNNYSLRMDRALESRFSSDIVYEHVYVDLDDTLLLKGKVNPLLAAFLYQCLNSGKKVHLLTSHSGDVTALLNRHRLGQLFDSVVQISKDDRKTDHIRERGSILIDDSFAERMCVHKNLGIPVFAVDAVECLFDWRE